MTIFEQRAYGDFGPIWWDGVDCDDSNRDHTCCTGCDHRSPCATTVSCPHHNWNSWFVYRSQSSNQSLSQCHQWQLQHCSHAGWDSNFHPVSTAVLTIFDHCYHYHSSYDYYSHITHQQHSSHHHHCHTTTPLSTHATTTNTKHTTTTIIIINWNTTTTTDTSTPQQ